MREGPSRFGGSQWRAFDGTTWTAYDGDRAAAEAWYPDRSQRTRLGWEVVGDTMWLLEAVQLASTSGTGLLPGLNISMIPGMGSFMYDYCLTTYDGQEWKKQTDLPGAFRFGELVVDRRGDKWVSLVTLGDIVMGGGVGRFDGQEWTVYNKSTGLPSDYVAALSTDSRGNVWVSTMMGDLSRWDGSGWTYLPGRQGGRGDQDLGRCAEDRQGQLWFPSKAGVLVYVSNE